MTRLCAALALALALALSVPIAGAPVPQNIPTARVASGCATASSFGFKMDGTDETARLNAVLAAFYAAGGGCIAVDCGKTIRIDGQIVFPKDAAFPWRQPPYRITSTCGSGGAMSDAIECNQPEWAGAFCFGVNTHTFLPGASLDLRYGTSAVTGYQNSGVKLLTTGSGRLTIDNVTLETRAPVKECATFLMTTLTALNIDNVTFKGWRNEGVEAYGCSDGIQLGGVNGMVTLTGTITDRYSGYGTFIRNSFFSRVSRAIVSQTGGPVDQVQIHYNTIDHSSGNMTGAAIELNAGSANAVSNNRVDGYQYKYGIWLGGHNNYLANNTFWDQTNPAAFAYCSSAESVDNLIVDMYSTQRACSEMVKPSHRNLFITKGRVVVPRLQFTDGTWISTAPTFGGAPGADVYVDAVTGAGNDASTACAQTAPCATLAHAAAVAPGATAHVLLRDGTTWLQLPAVWTTLQAMYLLNEGASAALYDVANGHHLYLSLTSADFPSPLWDGSTPTKGLTFDGGSHYVPATGFGVTLAQPNTFVFVHNTASHPGVWVTLFDWDGIGPGAGREAIQYSSADGLQLNAGSNVAPGLTNVPGTPEALAAMFDGASSRAYRNVTAGTNNPVNPGVYAPRTSFRIGRSNTVAYYKGTISLVMIYGSALSEPDWVNTVYPWVKAQSLALHGVVLP